MPWYIHINYYIFFETKQSIFMLSFKHPDYISGTAKCWYFLQSWTIFSWSGAAPRVGTSSQCLCCKYLDIRTKCWIGNKLKPNFAQKYLRMSEYLQQRHWEDVLTLKAAPDQENIVQDWRKSQRWNPKIPKTIWTYDLLILWPFSPLGLLFFEILLKFSIYINFIIFFGYQSFWRHFYVISWKGLRVSFILSLYSVRWSGSVWLLCLVHGQTNIANSTGFNWKLMTYQKVISAPL